jgi:hypothetical protein
MRVFSRTALYLRILYLDSSGSITLTKHSFPKIILAYALLLRVGQQLTSLACTNVTIQLPREQVELDFCTHRIGLSLFCPFAEDHSKEWWLVTASIAGVSRFQPFSFLKSCGTIDNPTGTHSYRHF